MMIIKVLNKFKKFFLRKGTTKFFTADLMPSDFIKVGKYTYGKPRVYFGDSGKKLYIGAYCSIAGDVEIFLGGNHRLDWITTYPFNVLNHNFQNGKFITGHPSTKGDVRIENDVWIGSGVKILSGVHIGNGAVVAAYSVVTKNIGAYEIWGGNPAKLIRKRFSDEIIEELLNIQWWEWSEEAINENLKTLCSDDFEALFKLKSNG